MRKKVDLSSLDPVSQRLWITTDKVVIDLQKDVAELAGIVKELALAVFELEDRSRSEGDEE